MKPCEAWKELLIGKDRGKIYDHFSRERTALIDHLAEPCPACVIMLLPIDDELSRMPKSAHLINDPEFAKLIRELYKKAQGGITIVE